jgi:site-specific DNA recombinase
MNTTTARREVIYARLSENPNEKTTVARGIADCEAHAARSGSIIVGVFSDDDISAYTTKKRRPGFEAMMDFIRENPDGVDSILTPHTSRLVRNDKQRADTYAELKALNVGVNSLSGGLMDLNTSDGMMRAGMMGVFDTVESAVKGERVKRVAQERAAMGKAHGAIAFGWRRDVTLNYRGLRTDWHDVEEPRAAAIVREIVARLGAGETVGAVTRDLNARHIPTPREAMRIAPGEPWVGSKPWTTTAVKHIATRPANLGMRDIHGEIGTPAIVDPVAHARVLARFSTAPGAGVNIGGRDDRRYLLTYGPDYTCGVCGSELRMARYGGNRERKGYTCDSNKHVIRPVTELDQYVAACLIGWLAVPANVSALLNDDAAEDVAALIAERDALQAESDAIGDAVAARVLTIAQAGRANAAMLPAIDALTERITRAARRKGSPHIGPLTWHAWNDGMDIAARRRLLAACHVTVRVMPGRPGRGFKPDTVEVAVNGDVVTVA